MVKKQSDQGLHCLLFLLHLLNALLYGKTILLKFYDNYSNYFFGCPNFKNFTISVRWHYCTLIFLPLGVWTSHWNWKEKYAHSILWKGTQKSFFEMSCYCHPVSWMKAFFFFFCVHAMRVVQKLHTFAIGSKFKKCRYPVMKFIWQPHAIFCFSSLKLHVFSMNLCGVTPRWFPPSLSRSTSVMSCPYCFSFSSHTSHVLPNYSLSG